tara:strand:- start:80 stop:415 length:336 start_codon:yes stop_codon:yes gene_type:complete
MIHPTTIVNAVCGVFHVKPEDLSGPARERTVSMPRQIAAYLIYKKCDLMTFQNIADMFGRTDHTTARFWIKTVEANIANTSYVARFVDEVEQALESAEQVQEPEATPEPVT